MTTFRRPGQLRVLLESLSRLQRPSGDCVVLVVDNDPGGSAAEVVDEVRAFLPPVRYEIEAVAGISHARNHVVAMAREAGASLLAFVDDDERVDERWLVEHLAAIEQFDADAVVGPVLPEYATGVEPWIRDSGYFDRGRRATGRAVEIANTGNCVVRVGLFDTAAPFPPALRVGEDTFFFLRALRSGARVVWCDEAIVFEHVPAERGTFRWILRRAYDGGLAYSRCVRLLDPRPRSHAVRAMKCGTRIVEGLVRLLPGVFRGRRGFLRAAIPIVSGLGGLRGLRR